QGKHDEADPLYVRALEILGATVGQEHTSYASTLNNRAGLLAAREEYTEALPLLERAVRILTKKVGGNHEDAIKTQDLLERVRDKVRAQLREVS
ncbi:unnamed protein product, partial [Ectocarpus sp. 8 AP-2014]